LDKLGLNLGYLIVQIFSFGIIFIVLRAWVYKPVLTMLDKRRRAIAQGLEDARVAGEARANAELEAREVITQAQLKANEIIKDATDRAGLVERELRAAADADTVKLREAAMKEMEEDRSRILGDLRSQVVTLSMAATQKLIGESLTQERQRALLQEFFSGVRSGKVVVWEGAEIHGENAEVTSALPLTSEEQASVKKDMIARMGGAASVSFRVDPKILGGLVVRVGDRVVDGSVAGQLQNLRQNLH
jgi:F-type H+-transporting ATPase subunit b